MGNETYSNKAQTTLNGAINNSVTSIIVTSAALFPSVSDQFYRIIIEDEIMFVTGGQGTTTWTVIRGAEGTTAVSHADLITVTAIVTKASLLELQWKDKIVFPSSAGHVLDDEFDDASLDSSWIRVDNSGDAANVTWTESSDVLSMKNLGADAAARYHALLKPLNGVSFPVTIEGAMRHFSNYATNYFMLGVGFSDGTTYGAGKQVQTRSYTYSSIATALRISATTNTNFNTEISASWEFGDFQTMGGPWFWRIIWSAANTFQCWFSPDGVSWIQFATNISYTMTPTHVGIFTSNWGGAGNKIGTIEYFRVFTSNKAGNP